MDITIDEPTAWDSYQQTKLEFDMITKRKIKFQNEVKQKNDAIFQCNYNLEKITKKLETVKEKWTNNTSDRVKMLDLAQNIGIGTSGIYRKLSMDEWGYVFSFLPYSQFFPLQFLSRGTYNVVHHSAIYQCVQSLDMHKGVKDNDPRLRRAVRRVTLKQFPYKEGSRVDKIMKQILFRDQLRELVVHTIDDENLGIHRYSYTKKITTLRIKNGQLPTQYLSLFFGSLVNLHIEKTPDHYESLIRFLNKGKHAIQRITLRIDSIAMLEYPTDINHLGSVSDITITGNNRSTLEFKSIDDLEAYKTQSGGLGLLIHLMLKPNAINCINAKNADLTEQTTRSIVHACVISRHIHSLFLPRFISKLPPHVLKYCLRQLSSCVELEKLYVVIREPMDIARHCYTYFSLFRNLKELQLETIPFHRDLFVHLLDHISDMYSLTHLCIMSDGDILGNLESMHLGVLLRTNPHLRSVVSNVFDEKIEEYVHNYIHRGGNKRKRGPEKTRVEDSHGVEQPQDESEYMKFIKGNTQSTKRRRVS
jgi:hypothetical protein